MLLKILAPSLLLVGKFMVNLTCLKLTFFSNIYIHDLFSKHQGIGLKVTKKFLCNVHSSIIYEQKHNMFISFWIATITSAKVQYHFQSMCLNDQHQVI